MGMFIERRMTESQDWWRGWGWEEKEAEVDQEDGIEEIKERRATEFAKQVH